LSRWQSSGKKEFKITSPVRSGQPVFYFIFRSNNLLTNVPDNQLKQIFSFSHPGASSRTHKRFQDCKTLGGHFFLPSWWPWKSQGTILGVSSHRSERTLNYISFFTLGRCEIKNRYSLNHFDWVLLATAEELNKTASDGSWAEYPNASLVVFPELRRGQIIT